MKNHQVKKSVWLTLHKKHTGSLYIPWSEAVDEAICFGWIDSTRRPVDEDKFKQLFSKRKPNGTWSKVNKEKAKSLIKSGLMYPQGLESVDLAKKNGAWNFLDEVELLIISAEGNSCFYGQIIHRMSVFV